MEQIGNILLGELNLLDFSYRLFFLFRRKNFAILGKKCIIDLHNIFMDHQEPSPRQNPENDFFYDERGLLGMGEVSNRLGSIFQYILRRPNVVGGAELFADIRSLAKLYAKVCIHLPVVQGEEEALVAEVNQGIQAIFDNDRRLHPEDGSTHKFRDLTQLGEKDYKYTSGMIGNGVPPVTVREVIPEVLSQLPNSIQLFSNIRGGIGDLGLIEAIAEQQKKTGYHARYFRMSSQKLRDEKAHIFPFEHDGLDRNLPAVVIDDLVVGGKSMPASIAMLSELGFKDILFLVTGSVGYIYSGPTEGLATPAFKKPFSGLATFWRTPTNTRDWEYGPILFKVTDPAWMCETYRRMIHHPTVFDMEMLGMPIGKYERKRLQ
jgi:hypothetical protein